MNNKGQSILSEYVMIFFVVIAAVVAMDTFIERGLKARIHDTRNFMIDSVVNSGACDANCLIAAGATNQIPYEYEPYYEQMLSDVGNNSNDNAGITPGTPTSVVPTIYTKGYNEDATTVTTSNQLPPCAGANPEPGWCNNPSP